MMIANTCRRFLHLMVLAALVLAAASLCAAQKNLVYINSDITTSGQNSVIVLANDGAGNLSAIPGSPFATGGTGVGGPPMPDAQWDSDGEIAINKAGTLLFTVNGHSNNISGFNINSDGSLSTVAGSPFASGGQQPASIAYLDNALGSGNSLMVVVNKNSDINQTGGVPNYTTFTVNSAGQLTMNANSTLNLPAGTSPSQAIARPKATNAFFGLEFMNGTISSYKLNRAGIITLVSTQVPPGSAPVMVGGVAHPTVRGIYLTLPAQHQVGVYTYDTTNNLSFTREVNNTGMAVCWAALDPTATRLYTAETTSGTISYYDVTATKTPVLKQHLTVNGTTPLPTHMKVDPTGKWLYVLDRNGVVHVFDIAADGTVSENHTPFNLGLPSGTVPIGMGVLLK